MERKPDPRATARTRARYQRLASIYDGLERWAERRYSHWREDLWRQVRGQRILEVGVGTGKNMPYYPHGAEIVALDLTPGMLERARERARRLGLSSRVHLQLGDVQALPFPDASFDAVVSTFVFCSVPDPVLGLQELRRVLHPEGRAYFLEHMRAEHPWLGRLMDGLNPLVVRMMGANINRRTLDNLRLAGFTLEEVTDLSSWGIFRRIVARP